jgi:hypothetical protein
MFFLELSSLELQCAFHIFERHGVKHATGKFENLPFREARRAILARKSLNLTLDDGRTAKILIADVEGNFSLSDLSASERRLLDSARTCRLRTTAS